jgi:hypothetical protein
LDETFDLKEPQLERLKKVFRRIKIAYRRQKFLLDIFTRSLASRFELKIDNKNLTLISENFRIEPINSFKLSIVHFSFLFTVFLEVRFFGVELKLICARLVVGFL